MDLSGDITDVFAFTDATNVNLIMDVGANATATTMFSNAVQYAFHVRGVTSLSDTAPFDTDVICTFDATNKISCWIVQGTTTVNFVNGDASATTGLASADGKIKVFAGARNDPFFFNIQGFRNVTHTVATNLAAFGATATPSGCPQLDTPPLGVVSPASSAAVRTLLTKGSDGVKAGVDDFMKGGTAASPFGIATLSGNVLSLVVAVPKTVFTNNGAKPILGVWAGTYK